MLDAVVDAVAGWQRPGMPVQLHPGDLGWNWSFGTRALTDALRVWTANDRILAVGLIDGPGLVRMGIDPEVGDDEGFAARLLDDLERDGTTVVEARFGDAFRGLLRRRGWTDGDAWSPLVRDLSQPVEDCGLRIEVVGEQSVTDRVSVQRASFDNSTFSAERWRTMAAAPPYRKAKCLVGFDLAGVAVATTTVWPAGAGRPGLIEPLGVHREHRRLGHGRAITLAAASAPREMGASSVTVCTPSSNVGAVAAYVSAGMRRLPEPTDFRRPARSQP
ncbi:GNAT family N-acetyltransferase [Actinoplanes couchii]|uniref:N-acetyltransferase domain-containing protein n=1 Tax=Actinoplanes couchii TaxID=403638 RepID=A0ABQ3XS74_9ACTN|nr:GNAT family N-acetyltransferase [Actinoplanes couchii]MDR6317950.1 ribosomal protein S18 acetylase RimI-like enzyme [Actinoplanes couchii]GID61360.1 hypothetical protein Aco03nite_097640 [Actinoplanes couchii]